MKQDYLFLQTYARAHGLGAFKARTMEESKAFAEIVVHIADESKLHIDVRSFSSALLFSFLKLYVTLTPNKSNWGGFFVVLCQVGNHL